MKSFLFYIFITLFSAAIISLRKALEVQVFKQLLHIHFCTFDHKCHRNRLLAAGAGTFTAVPSPLTPQDVVLGNRPVSEIVLTTGDISSPDFKRRTDVHQKNKSMLPRLNLLTCSHAPFTPTSTTDNICLLQTESSF